MKSPTDDLNRGPTEDIKIKWIQRRSGGPGVIFTDEEYLLLLPK